MSDHKSVLQSLEVVPFPTWKGQMKGYLQIQGLKMYIDSTVIAPKDPNAALAHNRNMGKTAEHFKAKTGNNQAKVVQEFFSITFKQEDVKGFLTDLNGRICNIKAVGVKIFKAPEEFTLHKTWMSEFLLSRLLNSLNLRDILLTKHPLTIEILKTLLKGKHRDQASTSLLSMTPVIKQE
ncbi:hypothetical protein PTTG_03533 [Puccinia triticina 1-1 BBBD Race 1]|uniref:Uncharacterized protein n=1 Tax=Puccinia triticina (isolate 1-1 / race 1 (BBBD)) TaxID=630390 RepID=A0A180GX19_PUCT1|nr:hypothetical protein PTTG_03533 [Puccinia triticina 1-1 BBBD Race 1]